MKVNFPTQKNKKTPLNKIFQLQLILELSQLQEIFSAFSELLLFFTEYTFLFETSPTGTSLSKSTYTPSDTSFSTQDPARDGGNWYGYCGENPLIFIDPNGLETWNSTTLTKDVYNKNYQLQRQYSWEQIQQHFTDNPKGIVYRYDTVSYSLGHSERDFPNMEKPGAEIAWGLASLSKLAGSKVLSWIKNGITSAFGSGVVDTAVQVTNMSKNENLSFNTNELFIAAVGGFVSGFVTGGVGSIPGGGSPNASIVLANAVGGFSGSMTSQLLYNVQNGESLSEGMGAAYMYGAAGGIMVGGLNVCFPQILPGNIGQVLRDSIKEEIVNTATGQVIEEKINETR